MLNSGRRGGGLVREAEGPLQTAWNRGFFGRSRRPASPSTDLALAAAPSMRQKLPRVSVRPITLFLVRRALRRGLPEASADERLASCSVRPKLRDEDVVL